MTKYCENLIGEAARGILSQEEVKGLMDDLKRRSESQAYKDLKTTNEKLDKAAEDMANESEQNRLEAKRAAQIKVLKSINLRKNYMDKFKDQARALQALADGVQSNIKNAKFSIGAMQKARTYELMGKLNAALQKDNLQSFFEDKSNELDIAKAMYPNETTGNVKANQLAGHFKDVYDAANKMYYENGIKISELPDFIAHQSYSQQKMLSPTGSFKGDAAAWIDARKQFDTYEEARDHIRKTAKDRWMNQTVPRYDLERIASEQGLKIEQLNDDFFSKIYDDFIARDHSREPNRIGASDSIGKPRKSGRYFGKKRPPKVNRKRVLHFKGAQDWVENNRDYGTGTLQQAIVSTIEKSGSELGMMSLMGPEPQEMWEDLVSYAKYKDPYVSQAGLNRADLIWREVSGQSKIPVDHTLATTMQAARAYLSMSKLAMVLPTSFNDIAIRASKMQEYGVGFFESYADAIGNTLKSGLTKKEQQIFLDSTGIIANTTIGHPIRYMSAGDSPAETLAKQQKVYWNVTGMNPWDKHHESGFSSGASRILAMRRGNSFSSLPKTISRNLKLYGMEEPEWDLIRHNDNVMTLYSNKKFIAPDAAKYFTDDSIKEYINTKAAETGIDAGKISEGDIQDVKRDMEDRLRTFFINETGEALIRPSASDRAFLIRGTRPGTPLGEIARSFAMFKTFSIAMTRRVGARLMMGVEEGQSIFDPRGRNYAGMTQFLVMGTLMGYIGNTVKDIARGNTPAPPNSVEAFTQAFSIGAMGIYGEFLFEQYNKYGESFTGKVAGPVFGTLDDVVRTAYKIAEQDKPAIATLNTAEKLSPFGNIMGFRTALDFLFLDNIKENLSPGYKRRVQQRLEANDQERLF